MGYEHQHISIADYFNSRGNFLELGVHLSRCEDPELTIMNDDPGYPAQARKGMRALTVNDTSYAVLKLTKALQGYENLWAGLKAGFSDGLKERIARIDDDTDLVRLITQMKSHPELFETLLKSLRSSGHALEIKQAECGWHQKFQIISLQRSSQTPQIYVDVLGRVARLQDLGTQDRELQQQAQGAFPQFL